MNHKKQLNEQRQDLIESFETSFAQTLSQIAETTRQMRDDFHNVDIWDEKKSDQLLRAQASLNAERENYLKRAFSSFLIPRVNKHFTSWQISNAFNLEHTSLQHRAADEFELIEAPDILALSKQMKDQQAASVMQSTISLGN